MRTHQGRLDRFPGFAKSRQSHRTGWARPQGRRLACEPLEDRRLLSIGSSQTELFSASPALFVQNQGQWADASIRYLHQGNGVNVAMTDAGPVFQVFKKEELSAAQETVDSEDTFAVVRGVDRLDRPEDSVVETTEFSVSFEGANASMPIGQNRSETVFNYYVGDQSTWRTAVPGYETVAYENLYDGVDLYTWGRQDSLKYEFHVAPGADYRQIQITYTGVDGLWLDDAGALHVQTTLGDFVDEAPCAYQQIAGQQVPIPSHFELLDADTYTFALSGEYDSTQELVIDPNLAWSRYLGSGDEDWGNAIAVDTDGNAFVAGVTYWSDYSEADVLLAKITPSGSLAWATYLGGTSTDRGEGIAVDDAGNCFVTGFTYSLDFPRATNAFHCYYDEEGNLVAPSDAFVAKLTGGGSLCWATYVGGTHGSDDYYSYGEDEGCGVVVDAAGDVLVVGDTSSIDFDRAKNAFHDGGSDAFVAKLTAGGWLLWATYLGGFESYDDGNAIAIDAAGNAIVAGLTCSFDFVGAGNSYHGGRSDAFAAKVSSSGLLLWATYLGGSGFADGAAGIATDSAGNAFVTGTTYSLDFEGANNSFHRGQDAFIENDVFVAKLSGGGSLLWATYLGGTDAEGSRAPGRTAIVVDPAGSAFVTGYTASLDFEGAMNLRCGGSWDAFAAKLTGEGSLVWAAYLGGSGNDFGSGIALDATGDILIAGTTTSLNLPKRKNSYCGGEYDAFVAKLRAPTWAVAYYLAHGNNLATYQQAKFTAIANRAENPAVQAVLLYDFLDPGSQDAIYEMTPGLTVPSSYTQDLNMWSTSDIGLPAEVNMGDPASLSTFMDWVMEHYLADHYAIVLVDHGSGWESTLLLAANEQAAPLGICWDGGDYLTTAELGAAFQDIDSHRWGNIEVAHFDACLMQMIEVAYQIRNNVDFIVANENLGWVNSPSYEGGYLSDITWTTSPLELATDIATHYHNWEATRSLPHVVSVVDTGQMGNAYDALQTLGARLLEAIDTPTLPTDVDHFAEIRLARTNVQKFDENGNDVLDAADAYVDLKHFAQRLQVDVVGADARAVNLRAAAQALEAAMGSLYIPYFAQTSGTVVVDDETYSYNFCNAGGQSIYLPQNACHAWLSYYNESVLDFCNGNWDQFLDAYLPADLTAPCATSQSTTVTEGDPFWIEFRIENRGSTTAGPSYVRACLSTDNDLDTSDDYALPVKPVGALGPGESTNIRWDFTMPDLGSGSYPVWMVAEVDYDDAVSEYYEDNTWKIFDAFTAEDQETPPEISGLLDVALDEDDSLNNAIDLWAYTSDAETPNNELLFEIVGNTAPACGVSIDSNRYIDIHPAANWYGISDVTIRVTDPSQLSDTDTFRITVNSVNDPPVVVGLEDTPDPVTPTWTLTLTATGVADPADPVGYVTKVLFYRESNGQPGLQVGADTLVATDDNPADGCSAAISTLHVYKGIYTYYAQAEDNEGLGSSVGTSAPATTSTVSPIAGDLNSDGIVGAADLDLVRAHWGQNVTLGDWSQGDCAPSGGDGVVGAADLDIVRAHWGQSAPPPPPSPASVVEKTAVAPLVTSTGQKEALVQRTNGTAPFLQSAQVAAKGTVPFLQGENWDSPPQDENGDSTRTRVDQQALAQIAWAYQQEQGRLREQWQRGPSKEKLTDLILSGWLS